MAKQKAGGTKKLNFKRIGLKRNNLVIFMVAFAIIGAITLLATHAAGPTVSLEAENGTVTCPASNGTDSNASGGSYVQFSTACSAGVNKARPFATNSAWNTPLRGGPLNPTAAAPTWSDTTPIHDRMQILGPDVIGRRDQYQIFWSNSLSPVIWKFVLPSFDGGSGYNRQGGLALKQERGPSNLAETANQDHVLTLARQDTGRYIEVWQAFVDARKQVVTGHPYSSQQGVIGAGAATATSLSGVSGAAIGQWLVASGGKFAKITGVSGSTVTFTGGWIDSGGTQAVTPTQYDDWFISPQVGTTTTIAATSLTDTTKAWATNSLVNSPSFGRLAFCGQAYAVITGNTATQLTFSGGWLDLTTGAPTSTPANGSVYYVSNDVAGSNPATYADGNMITGSGIGGLVAQGGNTAGGRAANFPWAAGLITGSDQASGKINHALAMMGGSDIWSSLGWTAPATAPLGSLGGGPLGMGTRIAIPNIPTNIAVRSTLTTPAGVMLFDALINYGAFAGDYADGGFTYFVADGGTQTVSWDSYWALPFEHGSGDDWAKIAPLLRYTTNYP